MEPIVFFLSCLTSVLTYLLARVRQKYLKRQRIAACLLSLVEILILLAWFVVLRPALVVFFTYQSLIAIMLLMMLVLLALRVRSKGIARKAEFFFIFFLVAFPFVILVWVFVFQNTTHQCSRLARQPGIKTLFSFCLNSWMSDIRPYFKDTKPPPNLNPGTRNPRSIFFSSMPGRVYLTTGMEEDSNSVHLLILYDYDRGEILRINLFPSIFRGVCDEKNGRCFLLLSAVNEVAAIDDASGSVIKKVPTAGRPRFVVLDEESRLLFIALHAKPFIEVIHADSLEAISGAYRSLADSDFLYGNGLSYLIQDPISKDLFFGSDWILPFFIRVDRHLMNYRRTFFSLPNYLQNLGLLMGFAIGRNTHRLYIGTPLEGSIYVYNLDTMKLEKKIRDTIGLREIALDEDRNLLFAGNYVSGFLSIFDLSNDRLLDRIFIGRKNRQILYDPKRRVVFVTSANGFFAVDVSRFFQPYRILHE
jgi:DNA-binding beta-propeller fold protein YncE